MFPIIQKVPGIITLWIYFKKLVISLWIIVGSVVFQNQNIGGRLFSFFFLSFFWNILLLCFFLKHINYPIYLLQNTWIFLFLFSVNGAFNPLLWHVEEIHIVWNDYSCDHNHNDSGNAMHKKFSSPASFCN